MKKTDYSKLSKKELIERIKAFDKNSLNETEEALNIFKSTCYNSEKISLLVNSKGIILDINKTLPAYTKKDVIGQSAFLYIPESYHVVFKNKMRTVFKNGTEDFYELEGPGNSYTSNTSWYRNHVRPIFCEGKVVAAAIVSHDISHEKLNSDKASVSEEKYSKIFEHNPQPMFLYERETLKFVDVNKAAINFYGYSRKQFLSNMSLYDIRPKEEIKNLENHLKLVRQNKINKSGKVRGYFKHKKKNGEEVIVEIFRNQITLGGKEYNLALIVDVTDKLKTETEKELSEERFKKLSELTNEGIVIHKSGIILEVNQAFCNMFGYSYKEVIGSNVLKYARKDYHKTLTGNIKKKKQEAYIAIGIKKNKSELICELQGKATIFEGQEARVTVVTDISKIKEFEEQLELSKQRFKNLSDVAIEGIIFSDNGKIIDINNSALKMFGYKRPEELVGKRLSILVALQQHRNDLEKNLKKKLTPHSEVLGLKKDGTTIILDSKSSYINYQSKNIRVSVISDITQKKLAENKLVESQRFLSSLINNLDGVFYRCDWNNKIPLTYITEGVQKITGYAAKEFIGQKISFQKLFVKEDREPFLAKVKSAVTKKTKFEITYRLINKDGNIRWMLERGAGVYDEKGVPIAIEGYAVDITPIKDFEAQIQSSQLAYKNLVDNSPDGIIIHNQGVIKYVNTAGVKLFGFKSAKALIGKFTFDFVDKKYWPIVRERMQKIVSGENVDFYEYEIILANNKTKSVEIKGVPTEYNNEGAIMLVIHDLTPKKQIEQEKIRAKVAEESNKILQEEINQRIKVQKQLQAAQLYTQSIIQSSIDMISASDINGTMTEFNNAAEKVFGYKRSEVLGKSMAVIYGDSSQNDDIIYALNTKGFFAGEVINKRKNGELFYSYLSASVLKDNFGNIIGHMGVSRDISKLKEAEQKLTESEQRYKTLFNQAHLGIAVLDTSGNILQVNNKLCGLLNCSEKKITNNSTIFNVIHYEDLEFSKKLRGDFERKFEENFSYNKRLNAHSENRIYVNVSISLIKKQNNEPDFYVATFDDVTEQKIAQEKLQMQSAKLNAIFEGSSHLIWTINAKGVLTSFNSNFANYIYNLFGVIIDPYKSNLESIINKEQLKLWNHKYRTSFKGNQQQFEFRIINKKGDEKWIEVFLHPIYGINNKITEISGIGTDITERKLAERKVNEQAAKLNSIIESSSHLIFTINKDLIITSFNHNYYTSVLNNFGTEIKANKTSLKDILPGGTSGRIIWKNKIKSTFGGVAQNFEFRVDNTYRGVVWRDVYMQPIFSKDNTIEELSIIAHDITERKLAMEKNLLQAAKINAIFQTSSLMIYTISKDYTKLTSFNKNYFDFVKEAYGYETHIGFDFTKGKVKSTNETEYNRLYEMHMIAVNGKSASFETSVQLNNGEIKYFENFLDPIVLPDGSIEEIAYVSHNITEKKNAREQLLQSLNEKEVLLKEVHHRVKNNLQVISSILNLQSSFVKDEAILEILQESQNRIKSMSFIHETLYQTKNFSSIDFSDYITNIGNNLVRSYQLYENKIQIRYTLQHVHLDLDIAIPCGLIINELVSNALKYAYPGDTKGVIEVGLKQKDNIVTLTVADKGIGLPGDLDIENNESLGLQLVLALVEQINAKMEVQNNGGTIFIINFKKQ